MIMFKALSLLLLLHFRSVTSNKHVGPPSCPKHFYGHKASERCYGFPKGNAEKVWLEAAQDCASESPGLLANIPAEAQGVLEFLRNRAVKLGIQSAWVAAADVAKINEFQWMDKTALVPAGLLKPMSKFPVAHDAPTW